MKRLRKPKITGPKTALKAPEVFSGPFAPKEPTLKLGTREFGEMARWKRNDGSEGYGDVYRWLWRHPRVVTATFLPGTKRPCWTVIRDYVANDGVLNKRGMTPTCQALSETWARVNRNRAAREARLAAFEARTAASARPAPWPSQQPKPQARLEIVDPGETALQRLQRERRQRERDDALGGANFSSLGRPRE